MNIADIATIQVVRQVMGNTTAAVAIENLKPFILQALRQYLIPVLTAEQFDTLDRDDEKHRAACEMVTESVLNYAMFLGFERMSVKISSLGVQQHATDDSKPAPLETKANARADYEAAGHSALEELLRIMQASPDDFPVWKASPARKEILKTFFFTSDEFNQAQSCTVNREAFLPLGSAIRNVENSRIRPLIPTVFDAIRTKYQAGQPLTEVQKTLIADYFRPAAASLALAKALLSRAVVLTVDGTVTQFENITANRQRGHKSVDRATLADLRAQLTADGEQALADMMDFVLQNAAELDYTIPEEPPLTLPQTINKPTDRIYAF